MLCLLTVACPADPQSSPAQPRPSAEGRLATPAPTPSSAVADPTLRWGISEPSSIIPLNATSPDDLLVVDALYDGLTSWGPDLQVRPAVASSWRRLGPRRWRFELRRDATFSDGTPVTADHFVRTWTQLAARGEAHHHLRDVAGYRQVLDHRVPRLSGVRAVDRTTLDVRLSRPLAEFPAVTGHPALAPMLHPDAQNAATLNRPVGNGPFRMAEPWAHGRFVRLVRSRPAVGQPSAPGVPIEEIVFTIADPASAFIAFEQGGLDVVPVPAGGLDEAAPADEPPRRYEGPGLLTGELASTYLLVANVTRPPFDDVRARRGVSLALDRANIVDRAFEGNASPAAGVIPPPLEAGRRRACLDCELDRPRARRLLAAAGVDHTVLWVNQGGGHEAVAASVRRDLAAAGVRLRVREVPFERFLDALRAGRPGLFRFGWTLDYPTTDNALQPLFAATARRRSVQTNYSQYARPDVDRLLRRAAATGNDEHRTALFRRAEDRILDRDMAVIPVAVLRRRAVVSDRVRGLVYGPLGAVDLAEVRVVERTTEDG